jgi:muconolactone D-isomerase
MEFLVRIEVSRLDLPPEEEQSLRRQEKLQGQRYIAEQALLRIWRVPGRTASISLWQAESATDLHDRLAGFPMFPWMDIEVSALARHYLEELDEEG